ncbi:MAG TPA: dienelactone hydrolase family protein [Herpetosiphonaceae bacterium]
MATGDNTEGGSVSYAGPGEGFLALPDGPGPHPAVVVIQEWWGLNDHIKGLARRFAAEGFAALAPDLYHGQVAAEPDDARKLAMALEQDRAVAEIQVAIDYLIGRDDVRPAQVAVIGFCMGGGLALRMAVDGSNVAIVAPFYGRPLSPEDAARAKAPVVGSFGEQDGGIDAGAVRAMEAALKAAGVPADIVFYPAGHAFFNETRPAYDPESAAAAWDRTIAAFRAALGGAA